MISTSSTRFSPSKMENVIYFERNTLVTTGEEGRATFARSPDTLRPCLSTASSPTPRDGRFQLGDSAPLPAA